MKLSIRVVLSVLLLATAIPRDAVADAARRGLVFVKTNCSQCHAIGKLDESPLPDAPPLRSLHEFYEVEDLEESLAEGIVTGHPSMPLFQLDAAQISDVIAYLETLE
ncbi:MAG: c-type cytochrome [bacterium]